MQRKSRACFASHDEWLAYVRRELSRDEQPTALAYGRMELFLRFLELRGQSLPAELKAELDLILGLPDPDRADPLDTLNDRIMAHLIEVLFAEAGPTLDEEKHTRQHTPRQQTQELFDLSFISAGSRGPMGGRNLVTPAIVLARTMFPFTNAYRYWAKWFQQAIFVNVLSLWVWGYNA